jgi:hypothetical protein
MYRCLSRQSNREAVKSQKNHDGYRDRLEAVGKNIDTNKSFVDDGKNLFSAISTEELRACTTWQCLCRCLSCQHLSLSIILELRRSLIMEG